MYTYIVNTFGMSNSVINPYSVGLVTSTKTKGSKLIHCVQPIAHRFFNVFAPNVALMSLVLLSGQHEGLRLCSSFPDTEEEKSSGINKVYLHSKFDPL